MIPRPGSAIATFAAAVVIACSASEGGDPAAISPGASGAPGDAVGGATAASGIGETGGSSSTGASGSGATSSANGGTSSSSGGTSSSSGGTSSSSGGTSSGTGGSSSSSGGTSSGTGGTSFSTGGTSFSTGGTSFSTGGTSSTTGGSSSSTGGSTFSTGGSSFSTGGSQNTGGNQQTGGTTSTGGNASCTTDPTVYNGHITYYSLSSTPACHFPQNTLPQYYGAMAEHRYADAAACGACVEITNTQNNAKLTATIVDLCPVAGNEQWCYDGSNHIDLNPAAYQALGADNNPAITWKYVSCSTSGNIQYLWESSASSGWLALTIMNHTNPIQSVTLDGVALSRADYNVWSTQDSSLGGGPYTIRVTDIHGNVVQDTISLQPGSTITGSGQLPMCD